MRLKELKVFNSLKLSVVVAAKTLIEITAEVLAEIITEVIVAAKAITEIITEAITRCNGTSPVTVKMSR